MTRVLSRRACNRSEGRIKLTRANEVEPRENVGVLPFNDLSSVWNRFCNPVINEQCDFVVKQTRLWVCGKPAALEIVEKDSRTYGDIERFDKAIHRDVQITVGVVGPSM